MQKPEWPREARLRYLEIRSADLCVSLDTLIRRGKKSAIAAVIRVSTRVANQIHNLEEQAKVVAEAERLHKPRPEDLWFFDPARPGIARKALANLQQELSWLLSRPDSFWRPRRPHYSQFSEDQNVWRHA